MVEALKGDPNKLKKIEGPTILTSRGFETPVNMAIGAEEDILALLRSKGWSEEAIVAFKSGKIIRRDMVGMKGGRDLILGEHWEGKKEEEGH